MSNFKTIDKRDAGAEDHAPMSTEALAALGAPNTVYIRQVAADEVAVDENDSEIMVDLEKFDTLYAVHAANGERLALVSDRETAFMAARQHEMEPVSVH